MKQEIMKKRCKGCIQPAGKIQTDPMCLDFKRLIEEDKMKPIDAAWSCFHTCTTKNIAEGKTKICKGCAEYFGIAA